MWIACCILERHPEVARALVARFPYIIIDEAQDNSELHFEFFNLLKSAGLQNLEPVERYHQSSDKGSEYHKSIDTIHAVKGATFDAVLLFLSSDSRGQSISLKDFPTNGIEVMTESQRMIYVACSRATQFLALAVPSHVTDQEMRKALSGVDMDIREINL